LATLPFWLNKDFIAWISLLISNSILLFGFFGNIAGSAKYLFKITSFQLLTTQITSRAEMLREKRKRPYAVLLI